MTKYDVAIIGAGVVGLCIASELSKYKLGVACVEKEERVATGASGNNSGVIHSGINLKPGSVKARFCVEGSKMMYELCERLNVPCKKVGTVVVALNDEEVNALQELKKRADLNGVEGVRFLAKDEIKSIEPHVKAEQGLLSPTGGITMPKILCKELADDAKKNGVELIFNAKVSSIEHDRQFKLNTGVDITDANVVINSAGLYADEIATMVGFNKFAVQPWLGEYYVISNKKHLVNSMVYPAPQFGGAGLGIHLTKSLEGDILVGPNATKMKTKDHKFRSSADDFYNAIAKFLPEVSIDDLEYGYSGIRAKLAGSESLLDADFVIEEYPNNFIHLMGIESPGLTASPAIAKRVVGMIGKRIEMKTK
ncbi:MAG TPA: NAD(P)/FAD-dependent oxidoreductase [Nitrososphaerales archaeon]|nr:NAD(P)/FAD-dependent oxidoreductase [Nitrososphaerales archaeon]